MANISLDEMIAATVERAIEKEVSKLEKVITVVQQEEKLLTPAQAAEEMSKKKGTLDKWRHEGGGPPYSVDEGGNVYYFRSQIHRWLQERQVHNTAEAHQNKIRQTGGNKQ